MRQIRADVQKAASQALWLQKNPQIAAKLADPSIGISDPVDLEPCFGTLPIPTVPPVVNPFTE